MRAHVVEGACPSLLGGGRRSSELGPSRVLDKLMVYADNAAS